MTEYDNNLSGVLFNNDRKEKPSHPDKKGSCEINGTEFWISGWIKEGKKGKFMSLAFTPKEDSPKKDKAEAWKAGQPLAAQDDDIPW